MSVSLDRSTVHRVVRYIACNANDAAPLLEFSSYLFSKYMKFVEGVDLARVAFYTNRVGIFEKMRRDRQTNKSRK